jgi:multidrug resistance efflux pump
LIIRVLFIVFLIVTILFFGCIAMVVVCPINGKIVRPGQLVYSKQVDITSETDLLIKELKKGNLERVAKGEEILIYAEAEAGLKVALAENEIRRLDSGLKTCQEQARVGVVQFSQCRNMAYLIQAERIKMDRFTSGIIASPMDGKVLLTKEPRQYIGNFVTKDKPILSIIESEEKAIEAPLSLLDLELIDFTKPCEVYFRDFKTQKEIRVRLKLFKEKVYLKDKSALARLDIPPEYAEEFDRLFTGSPVKISMSTIKTSFLQYLLRGKAG